MTALIAPVRPVLAGLPGGSATVMGDPEALVPVHPDSALREAPERHRAHSAQPDNGDIGVQGSLLPLSTSGQK